ncbi:hypothetical protein M1I87_002333, partial [Serratia marcescens]
VGGAVCRPPLASIDEGLKGKSMLKRFALLCWCLFGANALAAGPNANIKYYGYDWLDFYETATPSFSATEALKAITDTGFSMTNLNVVHTMASLNLPVCAGGTCAVNIQAGSGAVSGSPFIDICPGAVSNSSCRAAGSWNAIWTVVKKIAEAKYKPGAIYFIDEPFDVPALQTAGKYDAYQYSSYVCTLRQAMQQYGVAIPVYTILSYRHANDAEWIREIQQGAPATACPANVKSTPDWVGVDNYNWSVADMWSTYNRLAPISAAGQKWVLVPPSTASLGMNDQQLHAQIQLYWDFINRYPTAPVVYIMNWRFDRAVTENRAAFPESTALLSFMANTLLTKP